MYQVVTAANPAQPPAKEKGLAFDDSIRFSDEKPSPTWCPNPRQIEAWAAIIRNERNAKIAARRR